MIQSRAGEPHTQAPRPGQAVLAARRDLLEEDMVLPAPRDLQVARRQAEPLETVALEDPLRGNVVWQRARLDPVQPQLGERKLCDPGYRRAGVATAIIRRADPVAEVAGLKWATDDVGERHSADDPAFVEDDVRDCHSLLVAAKELLDLQPLPCKRVELRISDRHPRGQKLAVGAKQIHKRLGILECYRPDLGHGRIMTGWNLLGTKGGLTR